MHIKVGEGLIQQHQCRLHGETARKRHPLALTTRQQRGPALCKAGEAYRFKCSGHPLAPDIGGNALDLERIGDIVFHAHMRPERIGLEHNAHAALFWRHVFAIA